ncbi:DUF1287 domain-containing protein [Clostridium ganghwense]|uniref:DUF1287 domain-containing protein n=1 Tax=Clostridium ganghwense TaxID=312089 RepID=A0ABT4CQV2_9CLOT|nr:DUF1287 domain-containing protein [Clostridium ganghwense]MCY6371427.1 DUF1287 domain-containing protein [Clostridium ganghwense]
MRKKLYTLILCFIMTTSILVTGCKNSSIKDTQSKSNINEKAATSDITYDTNSPKVTCNLDIPKIKFDKDKDGDGINDLDDILEGARKDAANKPIYKSAYYSGGYPPETEGVCTDVVWRAFKNAGYNLKDMVDKDIKAHTSRYPRVAGNPDPNIDFRRVKNLVPFFKKYAKTLTNEIVPNDIENLKQWQRGDIVVFQDPIDHIAIVSDIRREDGIPYIIHNDGPYTEEEDSLMSWYKNSKVIYHFRFE